MTGRFAGMLAVGLGLMGVFWWQSLRHEAAKVAASAPVVGCATGAACPADQPHCLTAFALSEGVCSAPCTLRSQCPDEWCCPPSSTPEGPRLCAPSVACARLGLR